MAADCPKCKARNAVIIDEFMTGAGSTENRQNGDKANAWDRAKKCVICGYFEFLPIEPMKFIKPIRGRHEAKEYQSKDGNTALRLEDIVKIHQKIISECRADHLSWSKLAIKLTKITKIPIAATSLNNSWCKFERENAL